ncbi:MAG: ABC transporter permease [Gaiellales bacterium]
MTETPLAAPAPPAVGRTFKLRLAGFTRDNSYVFSLLLFAGLLIATIAQDGSFSVSDQLAIAAPMTLAALASAPSIIGGGFDISISPLLILTNCVFVVWLVPHGLGGAVSVPIMLGLGLGMGLITGVLIAVLRVQPVVVTLALFFALQGVVLWITPNPVSMGDEDQWVYDLAGKVGPIPGALFTIGLPLVIWFALKFVPYRRLLFAVGSNDATAFSAGVNVTAVRVASYGLGGLFAGVGGLALTGLVHSANAAASQQYALVAIAAVVLGGTSLAGGRGGLFGIVFAAFSIYLLQNLLSSFQVNPAWLQVVYGLILVVAVVIQGVLATGTAGGMLRPVRPPLWHVARRRAAGLVPTETAPLDTGGAHDTAAGTESQRGERAVAAWRALGRLQQRLPLIQLVALAAVFAVGVITLPGLGSWISIRSILVLAALVGLASCGQTLLILMGGFDLSVAGFIVAGGFMVTALEVKYSLGFGLALAIAILGSGILGGSAGYICHRFNINPLVVTLAMGSLVLGLCKVQMGLQSNGYPPQWVIELVMPVSKTFGVGIPPVVVIWIVVIIVLAIVMHRTRMGRNLLATGANPRAADRALINTRRVWVAAFAFSAITSALVGILIGGFSGVVIEYGGEPYLFQSVVAVIVGGTVFGGPGDFTRTSIGALFLTVLMTVMIGHGATPAVQNVVYGGIILLAVAIYGRERRLRDRV